MSVMSDYDLQLREISEVIGEATESERAQIFVERTVTSIINDLDQLCAFAADPATAGFIEAEKIASCDEVIELRAVDEIVLGHRCVGIEPVVPVGEEERLGIVHEIERFHGRVVARVENRHMIQPVHGRIRLHHG